MEQENQLANRGDNQLKVRNLAEFTELCEAEYNVKHSALVDEYTGRKEQLVRIKEMRLSEYKFITQIVDLNTQMNQGSVSPFALMEMEKALSAITHEESMRSNSLRYWQKEFGDGFIVPVVCDILNYFLRQFTVKESLDGNQIMQLACRLIQAQPELRIKELVGCLSNALQGKYGPTYQRVGMETISEWLTKFYEASAKELESKHVNAKPDESRGELPWVELDKKLARYKEEQEAKKAISDKIWQREKRDREVKEHKEKVLAEQK